LALLPPHALVNDINSELINVYEVIRADLEELILDLKQHKNEADYFYRIRALDRNQEGYERLSPVQRASRMLYLNKTCYNGLFRVNQAGQFNTPFGYYPNPNIVNEKTLRAVNRYLNNARITFTCQDFTAALKEARPGDFVYLDPPYDPISKTASFTGYDRGGFDRNQQMRLQETCDKLNEQGIKFLLSNSATDFIRHLYRNYRIETVAAKRTVNSRADRRGVIAEVLVMNY